MPGVIIDEDIHFHIHFYNRKSVPFHLETFVVCKGILNVDSNAKNNIALILKANSACPQLGPG